MILYISRDFTAKLYNNEDLPDVNVTYEAGPSNEPTGAIGPKVPSKMKDKKKIVDPMMEPTGTAPDKWDKVIDLYFLRLNIPPSQPFQPPCFSTPIHQHT